MLRQVLSGVTVDEVAQSIKLLLCGHKDLDLFPGTHKKLGVADSPAIPTLRVDTGGSWGLLAGQSSHTSTLNVQKDFSSTVLSNSLML